MSLEQTLSQALVQRKQQGRYRTRRSLESSQGPIVSLDGRCVINFCSNDYLGLAAEALTGEIFQKSVAQWGLGSGASHLVCGHSSAHHALENALAELTKRPRALLFSTGYMANIGVLQALLTRGSVLFEDKLNHASLLDGALLSRAKRQRYPHCNIEHLAQKLSLSHTERKLIVTDGIFSMDGDAAPLAAMAELAKVHGAWLMVDDAHGFGCFGEEGGGLQEQLQLDHYDLPVLMGTLGKAFGGFGAFVAGSETLIETLIQFARSYIYTTAMPPSVAEATHANVLRAREDSWRREQLHAHIAYFRQACSDLGLPLMPSDSPIQPLLVGDDVRATTLSKALFEHGFWVSAIRPPTVPEGTARLRITLTATHERADIERLVSVLSDLWPKFQTASSDGVL